MKGKGKAVDKNFQLFLFFYLHDLCRFLALFCKNGGGGGGGGGGFQSCTFLQILSQLCICMEVYVHTSSLSVVRALYHVNEPELGHSHFVGRQHMECGQS